jgi:hypothetical protein
MQSCHHETCCLSSISSNVLNSKTEITPESLGRCAVVKINWDNVLWMCIQNYTGINYLGIQRVCVSLPAQTPTVPHECSKYGNSLPGLHSRLQLKIFPCIKHSNLHLTKNYCCKDYIRLHEWKNLTYTWSTMTTKQKETQEFAHSTARKKHGLKTWNDFL